MASLHQSKRSDKKQCTVEVRWSIFFYGRIFTVFLFLRAVVSISIPTLILYMHHSAPFIAPLSGVTYKKFLPTMATIIKWQIFFNFAPNYWHATIINLRQTVRRTVNQIKEGKGSWVITSFKNITPKHQRKRLKKYFFSYHSRFSHQLYRSVLLMFSLSPLQIVS